MLRYALPIKAANGRGKKVVNAERERKKDEKNPKLTILHLILHIKFAGQVENNFW